MNTINITNEQKGILFSILEKYDHLNRSFSNSISKVIQGNCTSDDLLNISQNIDYHDIDFIDSENLELIIGDDIAVACFEF